MISSSTGVHTSSASSSATPTTSTKKNSSLDSKLYDRSRKSFYNYLNHRPLLMSMEKPRTNYSVQNLLDMNIEKRMMNVLNVNHVAFMGAFKTGASGGEDCCFCLTTNHRNIIATSNGRANLLLFNYDGVKTKEFASHHKEIITQIHFVQNHRATEQQQQSSEKVVQQSSAKGHPIDHEMFYTSSLDKTIKVWHGENNIQTLKDHKDWIRCLNTNCDSTTLYSGCISGFIYGWDINRNHQVSFQIQNDPKDALGGLNTINSLLTLHRSPHIVYSASRDGCLRMYDTRSLVFNSNTGVNTVKPKFKIKAHNGKMNQLQITNDDLYLLSSGRDSTMRLFDVRKLPSTTLNEVSSLDPFVVQTYSQHECKSYNVSSCFFKEEKYVLTGSEDNKIYIYDTWSGKLVRTLSGHEGVIHLLMNLDDYRIISNSIESSRLFFWAPTLEKTDILSQLEKEVDDSLERNILERVMRQHGDQILNLYHTNSLHNENEGLSAAMNNLVITPENQQVFNDIMQTFLRTVIQEQGQGGQINWDSLDGIDDSDSDSSDV
ncbi:hypothetical protein C9374_010800 [Naegleria lovaniensis]|uniref:Guanine nucleotide-binding protein subunit beta-like protein n=1 Tax=Naegleria lovaniensis TaxID=51637 RepID=A0AA88GDH2_NAELO|nr:uncharacterized protein C9374_010800 [Naegleria lovaniensis]KAG2374516.1 hypothetical protein C9374_010800 [Naegleria lovaniensis]